MIALDISLFVVVMLAAIKNLFFDTSDHSVIHIITITLLSLLLILHIFSGIKLTLSLLLLTAILYIINAILHLLHKNKHFLLDQKVPSIIVVILSIVSLAASFVVTPIFKVTPPQGPYSVGLASVRLTDQTRHNPYGDADNVRQLPIKIYYPTDTTAGYTRDTYINGEALFNSIGLPAFTGTYLKHVKSNAYLNAPILKTNDKLPLVLFSHGMGAIPEAYTTLVESLASNGYIVVTINHTDYSMFSDLGGQVVKFQAADVDHAMSLPDKGQSTVIKNALGIWTADVQFVLRELESNSMNSEVANHIDFNKVAVVGHSFGGSTAAEVLYENHQLKAGVDLDGAIYADALNGVTQPFMVIMSDREGMDYSKIQQPEKVKSIINHFFSSIATFTSHSANRINKVTIKGSSHSSFTDMLKYAPCKYFDAYPAQINPDKALTITQEYILAFLNDTLKATNHQLDAIKQDPSVKVGYKAQS